MKRTDSLRMYRLGLMTGFVRCSSPGLERWRVCQAPCLPMLWQDRQLQAAPAATPVAQAWLSDQSDGPSGQPWKHTLQALHAAAHSYTSPRAGGIEAISSKELARKGRPATLLHHHGGKQPGLQSYR